MSTLTPGRVALCRTPALADLDGDGSPEIVAHAFGGGLVAFKSSGAILWHSTTASGAPYVAPFGTLATVSIANMDGDAAPEIVGGGTIFDAKGKRAARGGPAGYRLADTGRTLESDDAAQAALATRSYATIAGCLNALGVAAPGARWHKATVVRALARP